MEPHKDSNELKQSWKRTKPEISHFLILNYTTKMHVLVTQLCPILCDTMDCNLPGSSGRGIFQARTREWVAISFSHAWKWKVKGKLLGRVRLLATPWTAAFQAPPSMGFSRQENWSGLPFPSLGDLPHPGIKPRSPHRRLSLYHLSHRKAY